MSDDLKGVFGEPWSDRISSNGNAILMMGQDEYIDPVQISPKEKCERIRACVNACDGMQDPSSDIETLRKDATRYRAQGFPDSYIIGDDPSQGLSLTKTDQIFLCGNSVSPPVAEAIVLANVKQSERYAV